MDNLQRYMKDINKYPLWSDEQTQELINSRDELEQRLIHGHLKLVAKIAQDFASAWDGFDVMDFIQEGNIALMSAAKGYDSKKGKFITYAGTAIRIGMMDFIKNNTGAVRLYTTRAQRAIFSNLTKIRAEYEQNGVSLPQLAHDFNVNIEDLEAILGSFNAPDINNVIIDSPEEAMIQDESTQILLDKIERFRETLAPRQLQIFDQNMYRGHRSLQELATEWKVSKQAAWIAKERVLELAREFFDLNDLKRIRIGEVARSIY